MAKLSDAQSEKILRDTNKELDKNEKEKAMKNHTKWETVKTWIIVALFGVIAGIVLYNYAFSAGYNAKIADADRIEAAVAAQVAKSKTTEQ